MRSFLLLAVLAAAGWAVFHFWEPLHRSPAQKVERSIWVISDVILRPLEGEKVLPDDVAIPALDELSAQTAKLRAGVEKDRCGQALKVLAQALAERKEIFHRAVAGSERTDLDEVSGTWYLARDGPKTVVDRPKMSHMSRSTFWTGAQLAKWRERCVYYRSAIKGLIGDSKK